MRTWAWARLGAVVLALVVDACAPVWAQHRGQPGQFDFFLLNLPWAPEFCTIQETSQGCEAHGLFVVHGLWPQNDDGTWPVYCSERPGPADPRVNLDITPDLGLLKHEWAKHGTCTTLSPQEFFADEHKAFHEVRIPPQLAGLRQTTQMPPDAILGMFRAANPSFPPESFAVSCRENTFSAIEVCLTKSLQPMACQGIRSCRAREVTVEAAR